MHWILHSVQEDGTKEWRFQDLSRNDPIKKGLTPQIYFTRIFFVFKSCPPDSSVTITNDFPRKASMLISQYLSAKVLLKRSVPLASNKLTVLRPSRFASTLKIRLSTKNRTAEEAILLSEIITPSEEELRSNIWTLLDELKAFDELDKTEDDETFTELLDATDEELTLEDDDDTGLLDEETTLLDEDLAELDEDFAELEDDFATLEDDKTGATRLPRVLNST